MKPASRQYRNRCRETLTHPHFPTHSSWSFCHSRYVGTNSSIHQNGFLLNALPISCTASTTSRAAWMLTGVDGGSGCALLDWIVLTLVLAIASPADKARSLSSISCASASSDSSPRRVAKDGSRVLVTWSIVAVGMFHSSSAVSSKRMSHRALTLTISRIIQRSGMFDSAFASVSFAKPPPTSNVIDHESSYYPIMQ